MIRNILTAAVLAAALSACSDSSPTGPSVVPAGPSLDEETTPSLDTPSPTPADTTSREGGVIGSGTRTGGGVIGSGT
jgi:hypothetical protein